MKRVKIIVSLLLSTGLLLLSCNKDSGGEDEIVDPRFFGSMQAKINGELKVWESAGPIVPHDYRCFVGVQSLGLGEPDNQIINIRFDIHEDFGCDDFYAYYGVRMGDSEFHYSTRDFCEDEDPFVRDSIICNDVSFTIAPVGNDIYRGTFSFVASNNCGENKVVITEGKFEIKAGQMCD